MSARTLLVFVVCCFGASAFGGRCGAQSLAEALDTPRRTWTLTTEAGLTVQPTADPNVALDGIDALECISAAAEAKAVISTRIIGPAVVRWQKNASLTVVLGTNAQSTVSDGVVFAHGSQVLTLTVSGNGVLDHVEVFDVTTPATLAEALDQPGVTWTESAAGPWRVLSDFENTARRLLLSPQLSGFAAYGNATASLRASFTGPRVLDVWHTGPAALAVFEESPFLRPLSTRGIPGPGPHVVRLDFTYVSGLSAYAIVEAAALTAPQEIGAVVGLVGVTWATDALRSWVAEVGTGGVELASAPVRDGETSWLEARVVGPGTFRFRSTEGDLNLHLTTQWRINGVATPLVSTFGSVNAAHLPAGDHVLRWEASAPERSRSLENIITLKDMQWSPSATPAVADVVAAEGATAYPWTTTECGDGLGWMVTADGAQVAIRKASDCTASMRWLAPGPGSLTARWRVTGAAPDTATLIGPKLASYGANPMGFYDWTEVLGATGFRFPATAGVAPGVLAPVWSGQSMGSAAVWLDDLAWSPAETVPLEDALDRPGRVWTTGGNAASMIRGVVAPVVLGATEEDVVLFSGLQPGDTAWMETTIQGPVAFLANTASTHRAVRLLVDGVAVGHVVSPDYTNTSRAAFLAPRLNIPLSAGSHTLRFEAHGRPAWRSGDVVMIDKVSIIGATVASAADLLDTPDWTWAAHGFTLGSLSASQSHDGIDALALTGQGDTMLTTVVNGPGLFSLWWKHQTTSGPGTVLRVWIDGREATPLNGAEPAWQKLVLPVPDGPHEICLRGTAIGQNFALDEAAFTPQASLILAEALDLTSGTFEAGPADAMVSAAMPTLAADGADAVVLFDRWVQGSMRWVPPGPGRLIFRGRSLGVQGSSVRVNAADVLGASLNRWTGTSVTVGASLTSLVFTTSGAPVLLDQFEFIADGPDSIMAMRFYEPWLATQGLTLEQAPPEGDYDGDGLTNGLEHAFGLRATTPDAATFSTATVRGLPRVDSVLDEPTGQTFIEISFLGVDRTLGQPQMHYRVETADGAAPNATLDWRLSPVPLSVSRAVGGLATYRWRSPEPVTPGQSHYFRVRAAVE